MRTAGNASLPAGISKQVTERFLRQWASALAYNERQVAAWTCLQRRLKHWQNRQRHLDRETAFLGFDGSDVVSYMLAAEPNSIATTKTGVEQNVQPNALARAEGPSTLVCSHVFFRPGYEALARLALWVSNPECGVSLYQTAWLARRSRPAIIAACVIFAAG